MLPEESSSTEITARFPDTVAQDSLFDVQVDLLNLLAEANERQMRELVSKVQRGVFKVHESKRHLVLALVLQKLATTSPRKAIEIVKDLEPQYRVTCYGGIFAEWAHQDLKKAQKHAKKLAPEAKAAALRGILDSRPDLARKQMQSIAREIGVENGAVEVFVENARVATVSDPESQWKDTLESIRGDNVSQWTPVLRRLAVEWVRVEPLQALDHIVNSLNNEYAKSAVLYHALTAFASVDPRSAFNWAVNHDDQSLNSGRKAIVSQWAKIDPDSALEAINALDLSPHKLDLLSSLFHSWKDHDQAGVSANIHRFPPSLQFR